MNKIAFWSFVALIFFCLVYKLSDILAPFIVAFTFSYLLQPVVNFIYTKLKCSRIVATIIVFFVFLSSFVSIILLIAPVMYQQITVFVHKIPTYKAQVESEILAWPERINNFSPNFTDKLAEAMRHFVDSMFSVFAFAANHLWHYTLATINIFIVVILVPIILYYTLRDWPHIINSIESVLPKKGKGKIREILLSINKLLSAYIRGQLNICLILSVYYITGFSIIGMDLAILLGIIAGFVVIVPIIGGMCSFFTALVSYYFAFGYSVEIVYIIILYSIGYILEAYILTPKILGNRIGIHPVWIIFAVFACGSLFGIIGIIFAIPIAGIFKVLLINLISYYKSTNIYKN